MKPPPPARLKLAVRGAVQGVGFRPFVHRLAAEHRLAGWVRNSAQGLFIEAEGSRRELKTFLHRLETEKPPHSVIQNVESSWLDAVGYRGFEIRESEAAGAKTAIVLPDIATCPDCLREIFDPANRRYLYPFTNCTHCGPRFTIISSLPYDRANTSMRGFTMCPQCRDEYENPRDRRFHAQPNACPACGPHLELWESRRIADGADEPARRSCQNQPRPLARDLTAMLVAANAIRRGQIVAVKGIGGFHLMADARNDAAIARLRARKYREEKPLALMFPSLAAIRDACNVSAIEERLLNSPEAPIVLLPKNENATRRIAGAVAPGNPNFGVMLPSNPLHHLLMAELRFPVVATSGNLTDEPICTDEHEAAACLGRIADLFLVHNRPIIRHVDDSIVRVVLGREMLLRRARGYAPLPILLQTTETATPGDAPQVVLAVGAHLKNSIALAVGRQMFISQHIGDLDSEKAHNAFRRVIGDFEQLYDVKPSTVSADLHPDYLSTRFAGGMKARQIRVQHHAAHVLSCMADNELAPPVLGVAWDGTGCGADGAIWGGEFLHVRGHEIRRVAHFRYFTLPGAEAAMREPRRSAVGLLYEMLGEEAFDMDLPPFRQLSATELRACRTMLQRKLQSPPTSSAGRLFDALASLTGLRHLTHFEGQAAMDLEFAIRGADTREAYPLPLRSMLPGGTSCGNASLAVKRMELGAPGSNLQMGDCAGEQCGSASDIQHPLQLDWEPMIEAILADIRSQVPVGPISAKFHNALAQAIVRVAEYIGEPRVVLSGGCFQNRYLLEQTVARLRQANYQPFWHRRLPSNDGGIAVGQIIAAVGNYHWIADKT